MGETRFAWTLLLLGGLAAGCAEAGPVDGSDGGERLAAQRLAGEAAPAPRGDEEPTAGSGTAAPVADLRTRKFGVDWPSFLGPAGDSKSPERGILTKWPQQGPRLVWQSRVGTGYGMPAISRGRLFEFDRYGNRARLTCMKSETGEALWQFEYPTDYEDMYGYNNGPRCSPVVDDDRVYIFGAEGMLHCLGVEDGQVRWKVDTAAEFGVVQNFFGVGSTPVVDGELLIAMVGGSPAENRSLPPGRLDLVRPNGSGIVAFDKRTGRVKYTLGDELASYASPALATIGGRRWCFALARGGLLGFEPPTGKADFHYPWRAEILESVNASNPVVVGDLVLISECYGPGSSLLRVRPGGYEVVWADQPRSRQKSMQTHWNTPVHHAGYVYGSSGRHSNEAELRCIELTSGKVMWSEPDLTRSSLLYVDGHFVCLTEEGDLLLVRANPERFELVARVALETDQDDGVFRTFGRSRLIKAPAWAAPILSHGLLYLRGSTRLACLELIPPP